MKTPAVKVPGSILFDRGLAQSAKLLWMVLRLGAPMDRPLSTGLLATQSGLARHTVRKGLAQLRATGWLTRSWQATPQNHALVPGDLLQDPSVRISAKLLYGALQLTPGFRPSTGQFTYADLSCLAGMCPNTLTQAIHELQDAGWLRASQRHRHSLVHFVLRNPVADRQQGEVEKARQRLEEAPFRGEALMREYLSMIVDTDEFEDNATPGFLVNPYTGEELQLDRYYPPRVAFEFNGPQHYGPTARYANEADFRQQKGRDYIKMGICSERGISLLVVRPGELCLAEMQRKVGSLLPLRKLDDHELLIAYLESVSRSYRRKAQQD